jgi:5-methylcytosine-specific restriction protein B
LDTYFWATTGLTSTTMTQNVLPVPSERPPIPDDVEPIDGEPSGNQRLGIGMFGRPEGATLKELRDFCNATAYKKKYEDDGIGMPENTLKATKYKLGMHWRWKDGGRALLAEDTGEKRGGEPVYQLNKPTAGAANIQPEVVDDLSAAQINLETSDMQATNTILYGPPGTGKTFTTIDEAIKILDLEFYYKNKSQRESLKVRFDDLVADKRIRFVTFHQSFSYEDFVEGLRAETDEAEGGQIQYVIEKGVFKAICEDASKPLQSATAKLGVSDSPRIWKISIDGTYESATRQYCLKHGEARIGWGHVGDLKMAQLNDPSFALGSNDRSTLELFGNEIAVGDVLLCIGSNTEVAAIGIVSGDYRYEATPPSIVRSDYKNVLPVNWIVTDTNFSILNLNNQKRFTLKTVYEITRFSWPELLEGLLAADVDLKAVGPSEINSDPFVLIIDEINRGNVSRIFGELITLIEPSKRLGAKESLTVTLPYSKKPFGVPKNVYLIGTMNTADKSLTGLDIALRRRFVFKEMPPKPELLDKVIISGLSVGEMLRAMNQRIEVLLDRDHCIGHAYFLPLDQDPSIGRLTAIFKQQVLPLLQEYFFEDWERIRWVLNDHRTEGEPFIKTGEQGFTSLTNLFGSKVASELHDKRWSVNEVAFTSIGNYINIIGAPR